MDINKDLEERFNQIKAWYVEYNNDRYNSISPEAWEVLHTLLYHKEYIKVIDN